MKGLPALPIGMRCVAAWVHRQATILACTAAPLLPSCVQLGRLCMYRQASTSTLAVDFLGASEPTIAAMSRAARAFCRDLASLYPGSTMVASALGRLPMGYSSP